ncbi:MAG: hypothetical protein QG573_1006 [Acidobacteriota bacterium]|nr:hypothetical protein [Acidobacteriota bacterium]
MRSQRKNRRLDEAVDGPDRRFDLAVTDAGPVRQEGSSSNLLDLAPLLEFRRNLQALELAMRAA